MAIIGATLRYTSNRRAGRLHVVFTRLEADGSSSNASVPPSGSRAVHRRGRHLDGGRTDDVAITGGTGRYAGARGTLRVTETKQGARFRLTFVG